MAKKTEQEYIGLFISKKVGTALTQAAFRLDSDRSKIVRQAINLWLATNAKVKV